MSDNILLKLNYDIIDTIISDDLEKVASITQKLDDDSILSTYIPSVDELQTMDHEKFAACLYHPQTGILNKYAMYDKNLTKLNIAYLEDAASYLPNEIVKVASYNLKRAAKHFELDFPETLEKFASEFKEPPATNIIDLREVNLAKFEEKLKKLATQNIEKQVQELDDSNFALPEKRKYPIYDEEHVKLASNYFDLYANEFEFIDKIEFAKNAARKAQELGVEVSDNLKKYASLDITKFNDDIRDHMAIRSHYTNDDELIASYLEIAKNYSEAEPVKIAAVVHKLDLKAGLHHHYGIHIEDPATAVFGHIKEAAAKIIDGIKVTCNDLKKLKDLDTKGVVDEHTKKALLSDEGLDVLDSLPKPIKEKILKLLGVK